MLSKGLKSCILKSVKRFSDKMRARTNFQKDELIGSPLGNCFSSRVYAHFTGIVQGKRILICSFTSLEKNALSFV